MLQVPALRPGDIAADNDVTEALKARGVASKGWLGGTASFRDEWTVVNEFATLAVTGARKFDDLLHDIVSYHEVRGGGRRWFRIDEKGLVRPASVLRDQGGSPYRFRLFSLARLALQCGVIPNMPKALNFHDDEENE